MAEFGSHKSQERETEAYGPQESMVKRLPQKRKSDMSEDPKLALGPRACRASLPCGLRICTSAQQASFPQKRSHARCRSPTEQAVCALQDHIGLINVTLMENEVNVDYASSNIQQQDGYEQVTFWLEKGLRLASGIPHALLSWQHRPRWRE